MHEALQEFAERMGLAFEEEGFSRSAGRILGFLLLNDGPFCLDDIAEKIQVSKASVSTNARLLEQAGFLERLSAPGDRRDYYRLAADPWERMFDTSQRRVQRLHDLMADGFGSLPTQAEFDPARERLKEAQCFYAFLLEELEASIERWHALKSAAKDGGTLPLRLKNPVAASG